MQFDKFTIKSQEAIQAAQQLAQNNGNQEIGVAHLIKAILEQPEGVVVPVLQKMGVEPSVTLMETGKLLERIPQVSGSGAGQAYASNELRQILDKAFATASQMQDDFVSQEHLFLTIIRDRKSESAKMLKQLGTCVRALRLDDRGPGAPRPIDTGAWSPEGLC